MLLEHQVSKEQLDSQDKRALQDLLDLSELLARLEALVLLEQSDQPVTLGHQVQWVVLVQAEWLVLGDRREIWVLEVSQANQVLLDFPMFLEKEVHRDHLVRVV